MNEIVRHIEYLLVAHDCVVIPGLGAVLAHAMPARCDEAATNILPPRRTFSFNPSLVHNDGLIVASVARSRSVSYDAARAIVAAGVESMRRALETDGSVSLGLAGRLAMTPEHTLTFEPASDTSRLSPAYMWLPALELHTVASLARRRDAALADVRPAPHFLTKIARAAASLVLLIALGLALTTPINIEQAQYASLGLESFAATAPASGAYVAGSSLIRRPGELTSPVTLCLGIHDDASEIADTAAHAAYKRERSASVSAVVQPRLDLTDKYCLVIASLATEAEAQKFIDQSKINNSGILAKDGRYRVYVATGATSAEARAAAAAFADRYPDAWVCRK